MLIEPCGRPLTVEFRAVPGVFTPGRLTTKSSALRLGRGRLWIWLHHTVAVTVEAGVLITSAPAWTTTCSSMPPTSMVTFTPAGTPALRTTLFNVTVLNPDRLTVTV